MDALDGIGYRGYCTFEYFHPYAHYPEALIYQTYLRFARSHAREEGPSVG